MAFLKCKICGFEFKPTQSDHYIACDTYGERDLYDVFDCPACDSQVIAQSRKKFAVSRSEMLEVCESGNDPNEQDYRVGDRIQLGKYSATCQKITDEGSVFMLDQYLDKPYRMNTTDTNDGGYAGSLLRKELVKDFKTDANFDSIRDLLCPVFEEDLVRIPTVGEFFGKVDYYEQDDAEQWEMMKIRKNRIADRKGEDYEWGWLQNRVKGSAADFAVVATNGATNCNGASNSGGVRPVLMLRRKMPAPCGRRNKEEIHG